MRLEQIRILNKNGFNLLIIDSDNFWVVLEFDFAEKEQTHHQFYGYDINSFYQNNINNVNEQSFISAFNNQIIQGMENNMLKVKISVNHKIKLYHV